jgi:undecaprenyl-diphosphatase
MLDSHSGSLLQRISDYELSWCIAFNRCARFRWIERGFAGISRLGDGIAWYTLALALPFIYGVDAVRTSLRMVAVGAIGLILYKLLKSKTERPRPFAVIDDIRLGAVPLDRYSFPSGHTLHAVAFTTVVITSYPGLAWLLVPFASLVALSRMVLGLHYPTDVLAGAVLGFLISGISLAFP